MITLTSIATLAVFIMNDSNQRNYAGDSSSGLFLWGIQREFGSTATTYQRVTTATDYADIGLPRSLQFDGSDDFLRTPVGADIDFTATDEMTFCAGVFKLSDATVGVIAELSTNVGSNLQTFGAFGPIIAGSAGYRFFTQGTTAALATYTNAAVAAPSLDVFTGLGKILNDTALLRIDGAQVANSSLDQGTGNYGTYPLFIGRRAGTSLPFNGRINQLIIRNVLTADSTLTSLERFVGQKTGLVIP